MLKGKDFHAVDLVFPSFAAFINRATGYADKVRITYILTTHLDLVNSLIFRQDYMELLSSDSVSTDNPEIKQMETRIFGSLEETNLFTLKFDVLDHISNDPFGFGDLYLLDSSAFKHFNCVLNQSICMLSIKRESTISKTIALIITMPGNDDVMPKRVDLVHKTFHV